MQKEIEPTNRSDARADFESLSKELVEKKEDDVDMIGEDIREDEDLERMWELHKTFGSLPK